MFDEIDQNMLAAILIAKIQWNNSVFTLAVTSDTFIHLSHWQRLENDKTAAL